MSHDTRFWIFLAENNRSSVEILSKSLILIKISKSQRKSGVFWIFFIFFVQIGIFGEIFKFCWEIKQITDFNVVKFGQKRGFQVGILIFFNFCRNDEISNSLRKNNTKFGIFGRLFHFFKGNQANLDFDCGQISAKNWISV